MDKAIAKADLLDLVPTGIRAVASAVESHQSATSRNFHQSALSGSAAPNPCRGMCSCSNSLKPV